MRFWMTTGLVVLGCANRSAEVDEVFLSRVSSCDELRDLVIDNAEGALRHQLSQWYGWDCFDCARAAEAGEGEAEGEGTSPGAASPGLTGTNTQETGVDEPDIIKSEGDHIFVLHGNKLEIVKAIPAQDAGVVSEIDLEGMPTSLIVTATRALALGSEYLAAGPQVRLTVLDVANRMEPRIIRTSLIDGILIGARALGDTVRVVTRFDLGVPIAWDAEPGIAEPRAPQCNWSSWGVDLFQSCQSQWERYEAAVRGYQRAWVDAVVRETSARMQELPTEELIPDVETIIDGESINGNVSACTDFYRTGSNPDYGISSITTVDLNNPTELIGSTSILGSAGILYSSVDQMYLAMPRYAAWDYFDVPPAGEVMVRTAIHQFDFADGREVRYVASGQVDGHLYGQFAMDEHEGFLRLVSTVERFSQDWVMDRSNTLSVLAPDGRGGLETVGQITDIAPDEQITAARMEGDKGYLVTFRQIDPLFALDLQDPREPRVLGELEIPGFSQYVHPLGPDHLLTVGTSADWGVQISIFDVRDRMSPSLRHQIQVIGSSEAQWDHKAFTFRSTGEEEGQLALPISNWQSASGASLHVFKVSAEDGITAIGEVSHSDLFVETEAYYCGWRDVRRGVLSETHAYSISTAGFKANLLADLDETVAAETFGETNLCDYSDYAFEAGAWGDD